MTKAITYRWKLREVMATRGMWATTDLAPLLEERGIHLSPAQVYRLVANTPERLSMQTLAAICDALNCSPNDVIETVAVHQAAARPQKKRAAVSGDRDTSADLRPTRARIVRDAEE